MNVEKTSVSVAIYLHYNLFIFGDNLAINLKKNEL